VLKSAIAMRTRCTAGALLAVMLAASSPVLGQGVALRGVSPVNESMGGAAVACPIDSAGAIHWNPASISGLPSSDISFGMALILPSSTVGSSVFGVSGSDSSEAGVTPVPDMAFVCKDPNSPWTWGLGLLGVGGSSVNYPVDSTNPILAPQPAGVGRLSANIDVLQIVPTASYQLNERLSVGFAPTVTMARLFASPLLLGPKDAITHEWSEGVGTRYVWAAGFQVGLYYTTDVNWSFGASLKSPQCAEPFRYKSADSLGHPVDVTFNLNYPLIASIGAAYTGFEDWTLACDLRFFDYADTPGFRDSGLAPDGALRGLGWNSIMSVALGAQRRLNDRCAVRIGYIFNENPIDTAATEFNVASPLILQHTVAVGASYTFAADWIASVAYDHCFQNSETGPLHAPTGALVGTVTNTIVADALSFGLSKRF
jgi:long-chain fatty acid transport protein